MPHRPELRRFRLLAGAIVLLVVVVVSFRASEAREFMRLAERAEPWWLSAAVLFQVITYLAQGAILQVVIRAGGGSLAILAAWRLSLVKLFVDQATPSAGVGGAVLVARDLERRGIPKATALASVVVNIASYHVVYVLALAAALVIALVHERLPVLVVLVSLLFGVFGLGVSAAVLVLTGRRATPSWVRRIRPLQAALRFVGDADPRVVRKPQVLAVAIACQAAIVLADAATIFVLIRAVGTQAPFGGVFASFMISSVFRTIAILPGGLGVFEAASVLTLRLGGVPVPVALAATLLFRGLSFWLPMIPGAWWARSMLGRPARGAEPVAGPAYWAESAEAALARVEAIPAGLSTAEAAARLARFGPNAVEPRRRRSRLAVLLGQLRNPLLLILVLAAVIAIANGDQVDAIIVLAIVAVSVGTAAMRESRAESALASLWARVRTQTRVVRDGQVVEIPVEDVVAGDVIQLSAGSIVPADALVLEATDCYVAEAALTGEPFPVEKRPGAVPADAPVAERSNCVFLGTNVRSGFARCLVMATGAATAYAAIASRLEATPPETEFDRGLRRFSYLLTVSMLVLVALVGGIHLAQGRPPVETLLFAIALAIGLSPELLPAILTINLARGASLLAHRGVLVRHLSAIENLGSMDVLCTDKTGTLTEGVVELDGAWDADGEPAPAVLELAARNAALATGLASPLDEALLRAHRPDLTGVRKLGEIPFDFERKRVSVLLAGEGGVSLVTKGAFASVLAVSTRSSDESPLGAVEQAGLRARFEEWSARGIRVVAVAEVRFESAAGLSRDAERDMAFRGFLTFLDRPKQRVGEAVADLARLGVTMKIISGDNALVTRHVAGLVGLRAERLLTGRELAGLDNAALELRVTDTDLYAEVDPSQKERIVHALRRRGHVVGFLGDGVNDAPAMHASDTSLSVETAVDVAREAADFVLLDRDLDVIRGGIEAGRRTFANTLKYILTTMSANLGNMLSMAAASLFLPFLPLLASQILLNNFLSDVPAIGIADDAVDPELVDTPKRWDVGFIGRFMLVFGLVSSGFDFLTFGVLQRVLHASPELFRTGWFMESLLTELVIALVVRTRRPLFRSRPGSLLLATTVVLMAVTLLVPWLPGSALIGFVPVPSELVLALVGITVAYVAAAELTKRAFYGHPFRIAPVSPRLGEGPRPGSTSQR